MGCYVSLIRVKLLQEHSLHLTGRQLLLREQHLLQAGLGLNLRVTTSWLCGLGQITSPLQASSSFPVKWAHWHHRIVGGINCEERRQGPSMAHNGVSSFLGWYQWKLGKRPSSQHYCCHPSPNPVTLSLGPAFHASSQQLSAPEIKVPFLVCLPCWNVSSGAQGQGLACLGPCCVPAAGTRGTLRRTDE